MSQANEDKVDAWTTICEGPAQKNNATTGVLLITCVHPVHILFISCVLLGSMGILDLHIRGFGVAGSGASESPNA